MVNLRPSVFRPFLHSNLSCCWGTMTHVLICHCLLPLKTLICLWFVIYLINQNSLRESLLLLCVEYMLCCYLCDFFFFVLQMTVYSNGVSVLMPGDDIPTFIAHPAPVPCPPQNISQSQHQHGSSKDSSSSNSIQECWRLFIYLHHHSPFGLFNIWATNHI